MIFGTSKFGTMTLMMTGFLIFALGSTSVSLGTESDGTRIQVLNTLEFKIKHQEDFLKVISGENKPSGSIVSTWASAYEEDAQSKQMFSKSTLAVYKYFDLEIDLEALDSAWETINSWVDDNQKYYQGILNYTGRSDEGGEGSLINWLSLNKNLRKNKNCNKNEVGGCLSGDEKTFLNQILSSLKQTPQFSGLTFRGLAMDQIRFDSHVVGAVQKDNAFVSSSLSYDVAKRFGAARGSYKTGILITKNKGGAAVSPLTFDFGGEGQEPRVAEYEVLYPPGTKFRVIYKVYDEKNEIYYVFQEQLAERN